jgi:predicted nucleotidyltransferase
MKSLKKIIKSLSQEKTRIEKKYHVSKIAVFGSYVRHEQNRESDVDIIVEFNETPDLFTFLELEGYLENILNLKVDLVRKEALRPQLKDSILQEAVYI